jgi:hypothetical protein
MKASPFAGRTHMWVKHGGGLWEVGWGKPLAAWAENVEDATRRQENRRRGGRRSSAAMAVK